MRLLQLVGVLVALALGKRRATRQDAEPENDEKDTTHHFEGT